MQQASQDENLQKAAKAALWTNAEGAWLYKRWDPQAKSLVTMENPPLSTNALLHTLESCCKMSGRRTDFASFMRRDL